MGSENNMAAVQALREIASIKGDPVSADIANAALARLASPQPDAQQGASSPASGEGAGCANCGGRDFPSVIAGDDGEAFCSVACLDQHEELGCPLESGDQYRTTPLAAATQPAVPQEAIENTVTISGRRTYRLDSLSELERLIRGGARITAIRFDAAALTGAGENGEQGA